MADRNPQDWFPAKTCGYGWGLPTCWQGWVVLVGFVILLVASAIIFPPSHHPVAYFVSVFALLALLIAVCTLKGEKPRWRWGKED